MPNRIIKESIRTSYEIDELSPEAEVSFYRLLTYAGDYGRFPSDIRILQSQLFPLRADIRRKDFNTWISELVKVGLITLYIGDDNKPYGLFNSWENHQQVRSKREKYPAPDSDYFSDLKTQMDEVESRRNHMISDDIRCPRESNPIQSESNPNPNPSNAPPDYPFKKFWDAYDKKTGKKKAKQKWKKLSKDDKKSIMKFIPFYKQYQSDARYRKNPTTFFNNRSWEDEFIVSEVQAGRTASEKDNNNQTKSNNGQTNKHKHNDAEKGETTTYARDALAEFEATQN